MRRNFTIPISIDFAVALLRIFPSLFMLSHGYEKLLKVLSGNWAFADPLGLGEGLSLLVTVFAEFFCSLLLIIGFLTRPALVLLMVVMTVAAFIVHGQDPFGVKEHALLYLVIYASIFITGPGRISLDSRLFS
jgi:putative oxidoreductase